MMQADRDLVQRLAAANSFSLAADRAANLVPAVQAILDADAQLAALDLAGYPAAGLPWGAAEQPDRAQPPLLVPEPSLAEPAPDDILFASISQVAALYRRGELSPVTVTERCLARIGALNPTLNAFITVTAEEALAAARRAEQELAHGVDRGLLHGIPVALKDLVDTAGIRTTCGSRILADHTPAADAVIVTRLRDAGAVIVGKTNLLEFAYGIVHPDVGPTWNPWDPARTSGGSSGGSAAAVATGMCYAAVGTDTGGSIRVPAAYCGVAGLKPTYGLTPLQGVFPLSWSLDHAGPLARSSADAALLLDALCGHRPQALAPAPLAGMRLGLVSAHFTGREMEPGVADVCKQACARLADLGAELVPVEIAHLDLSDGLMLTIIAPEAAVIHARWLAQRPQDYAPMTRQQLELGLAVPVLAYVRGQQFCRYLAAEMLGSLGDVDALLSPTVAWVAPEEDPAIIGEAGASEARRTAPYNLTGFPAHSVLAGFSAESLPVGLQIVTRPGADRLALAIGAALEAAQPEAGARRSPLSTNSSVNS